MTAVQTLASLRTAPLPRWLTGPLVPAATAAVLGLIGIGDKSMWLDEAFSADVARLPAPDLLVYLWHNELHASPYYVLLSAWSALGTSETVLRLLSVLIGVLAVVATYYVGRRYGDGFWAALVLAVSPLFVQFEQNAREYTLLAAWSAISTLAYLRYKEQPTRSRAAIYIFAAAAMIYVHPIGAFVIAAHGIWQLATAPPGLRLRRLAIFVPVAVLWLPMIRFMAFHRDKISWIPPLSPETVSTQFVAFAGGALALLAMVVLIVLAVRRRLDLPLLWLVVPIVGMLAVSLFQPLLQARYLIVVLPAVAVLIGRNWRLAVVAFCALMLLGVYGWYSGPAREDWRAAVARMQAEEQPADGVVFSPSYARLPLDYYGHVGTPDYPAVAWTQTYLPGLLARFPPTTDFTSPRIWLIRTHGPDVPAEVAAALEPYRVAEQRSFGTDGPWIELLTRVAQP
jgi:4-amino-4-deoxy-L-arabinose transferase-like glycosyltransferase